ncbi:MAG: hypothetical protein KAT66_05070, partial [Candidatus Lokiarchaeota archaeon]|nr:hypothetical protein [Candidatus Lokiarchaeota archaeon]
PKIFALIKDIAKAEGVRKYQLLFLPISIIIWLFIHSIIFELIGMQLWRGSYLIIGILNIASSPSIFLYKQFE